MAFWSRKKDKSPISTEISGGLEQNTPALSRLKYNPRPLEINLLTYKKKSQESNLLPLLLLILFLLGGLSMGYYYKLGYDELNGLQNQKTQLQAERERLQKESGYSVSQQSLQDQLKAKQANVQVIETQKIHFSRLINEIASVIPAGVTLTGMKLQKGGAGLSGFAGEYGQIAVFIAGMREKPVFKHVTLVSCGKSSNNSQVQFNIDVGWEEIKQ